MTQRQTTFPRAFAPLLFLLLSLCLPAQAYNQDRVATDEAGKPVRIAGSVVIVEPDIELSLVTAGGLLEPRREWSDAARRLYPEAVGRLLEARGSATVPAFDLPDDLPAESRLGQLVRLNEAVAMSIAVYTRSGSHLATKGRRLDWTLGDGVSELREATGADYALFTYVRDSYTSGGRVALRVLALLAGAAVGQVVDIGGGQQVGVATLVDLRTGQVVWFNLMANQTGDLRDAEGAERTAKQMLTGLPL
ncbi:hypothetical protein [Arenimonas caeni]|jgi:hypothetical protein|uniref:hypothetical protein n=1 Tax=Arenimonas caeni TaxID=2058085 RepID=UPI0013B04ECA|nr:hypothetical protein [Arenimonas caeni]MDY0022588.1 hypothetical protein [Arenimonas caeni]